MSSHPRILAARALVLLRDLEAAGKELAPEQLAEALGQLERVKALLWLRLQAVGQNVGPAEPDKLLTAEAAAERLAMAPDTLYRKAKRLPFTVRLGHQVRFSSSGIERFIRARQGKP